ncbi:MAG: PilZ domain-containing protein [Acidobacteriaceae bacterium]
MGNQSLSVAPPFTSPAVRPNIPANRRKHPRYACEGRAEVCVPHGGLLFRGKILDLSISGCFIETAALTLERGTPVEVYFVACQMQFRVAGHIAVLHRRRGAGIAFDDLGPRRIRQIIELLGELKDLSKPRQFATEA